MKSPEMPLKEFRERFGGAGVSDDDALLNYFAGAEFVSGMKTAGPARELTTSAAPLLSLMQQLAAQKARRSIEIERPGLKVRLRRS
jgi:oxaloacetate decarboxylase alpha subunit